MRLNLTGQKFGNLTVIRESHQVGKVIFWVCQCDCGKETIVRRCHLTSGHTRSCGCLWVKSLKEMHVTHGATSNGGPTPEYISWCQMKSRCANPNNEKYPEYGGRGIMVSPRWTGDNGFENFLADMGPRPKGTSLDRWPNNKDGHYEPGNCRWGTDEQQTRNKRNNHFFEYNGERMIAADWGKRLGIDRNTILSNIKRGKTFEEIVNYFSNNTGRKNKSW
jgi:hypothetical protein